MSAIYYRLSPGRSEEIFPYQDLRLLFPVGDTGEED